jgi:hypothetical protein
MNLTVHGLTICGFSKGPTCGADVPGTTPAESTLQHMSTTNDHMGLGGEKQ